MRQALAAVAALLVLGAVLGVAYVTLEGRTDEAALDAPDETVDAYLDAWADGDHAAMVELVRDPPASFVADHEQLREGLEVTRLTVERTDLEEDVDGRATATAVVTAELDVIGSLAWEVEVRVLRERGRWGVAWTPEALHPEWRPGLRFATTTAPAERAPILARDGRELAGPGERVTYGFEPATVEAADEVVEAFEAAIPGSGATAERLLNQGGLVDGWFYPVVSLSAEAAGEVGRELTGVPGVLRRTEEGARNLLADGFAAHVVGRTGEATAEELERLGPPYEPGDHIGRTGLEEVLERRLAAREEVRVELRDGTDGPVRATLATGTVGRAGDDDDLDPGPVTTTLDVTVQRAVENALAGRRTAAAIVVVDASDGAVRAAASRPIDGFNRAFEGRYPPGTAFASVVVDALVAEGGDVTATVSCPEEAVVAGRRVTNVAGADLGEAPLPEAAAAGCATALARLGAEVGADALSGAAGRFGAGVAPIVPLFANGLSFPDPVDVGEAAVAAAGQGRVEVSPLHLATIAAATTTGSWWPPYLLEEDGPGTTVRLAPGSLDGLEQLLAVTSDEVDGPGLAGITGEASGTDGLVLGWFVGTIDGLGVAVLLEDEGGSEAGVLASRFARELAALEDAPVDDEG
ncbi:NTF2-like N-terminal transpeptidase domain-containing protein [Nitriliruptor alkaliphilus]|uniref:NTF2-like N-terminal transpeptidase domain-containing protein n=1 Tax=Nitriliruptor alkaliphilus TaxID=427918 RepID=UPI0006968E4D|nr:NTF2-like N-terminal transpeptidase domain-containing protein [Nitriliruptor alkaliphilus]